MFVGACVIWEVCFFVCGPRGFAACASGFFMYTIMYFSSFAFDISFFKKLMLRAGGSSFFLRIGYVGRFLLVEFVRGSFLLFCFVFVWVGKLWVGWPYFLV